MTAPLLDGSSYAVNGASLPFVIAAAALGMVLAYAVFMRGAPQLRVPVLVYASGLLPFVLGSGFAVAAPTDEAAIEFFRIGVAPVPLGTVGGMAFELALAQRLRRRWWMVAIGAAIGVAFLVIGWSTSAAVSDLIVTPSGVRYFAPGPAVAPAAVVIALLGIVGMIEALRGLPHQTSPVRRRQLRGGILALGIAFLGLADVFLAFGFGWAPVSWLFVATGALLMLRSILIDDLLRARAVDSRAPIAIAAAALAAVGAWQVTRELAAFDDWMMAVPLAGAVLAGRLAVALGVRVWTIRPGGEGPLDRLAAQYGSRIHQVGTIDEVARRTADVLDLGLGAQAELILPARDDWSWRRAEDDSRLDEKATPEPLLVPWLGQRLRPIWRDELDGQGLADLRPALERLLAAHHAQLLVPLVARDDLLGLLFIRERASGHVLRKPELRLVEIVAERLAAALEFMRVAAEVAARAEIAREVELAAAVQTAFVPRPEPIDTAAARVLGTWQPASRCGGDWWGCYALSGGRALIVIGDVTGSGVAAAMVTAAAKGACDAAVRVMGDAFDLAALLTHLDGAIRRVGAGRFHLTCFASVVDPAAGEVRFANAGHVVPYVCRAVPGEGGGPATVALSALVARGNPLGAGSAPVTRAASRPIHSGDVLVWYTDGLVESRGSDGLPFGDRRLQRALRRLDPERLDPASIHTFLAAELAAHLGGLPPGDDMTLVIAQVT